MDNREKFTIEVLNQLKEYIYNNFESICAMGEIGAAFVEIVILNASERKFKQLSMTEALQFKEELFTLGTYVRSLD